MSCRRRLSFWILNSGFWILLLSFPARISAQDIPSVHASARWSVKKYIAVTGVSSLFAVTLVDAYFQFWKGNDKSFGFYDPNRLGGWFSEPAILGIDKAGHFYASHFLYRSKKNLLLWGGFDDESSTIAAAALTGGVELLIEVGDGFSDYAFDYRDLVADFAGIGFGILQDHIPFFRNFHLKYSYFPPDSWSLHFTKHYDGNIFWLAADLHNLLGEKGGAYWPQFLRPAVGFSVGHNGANREFIAGFDFDLTSLFGHENPDWELLGREVDLIHLPAPGVKFAPGWRPEWKLLLLH